MTMPAPRSSPITGTPMSGVPDPNGSGGLDPLGNPILSYGSRGESVGWLKNWVKQWNYYDPNNVDAVNGIAGDVYGWDVATAIAKLQQDFGIAPTGVANAETWALIQRLNEQKPTRKADGTWMFRGVDPPPVTTPNPLNQQGEDALAQMTEWLNEWGIPGLIDQVKQWLIEGASTSKIKTELYKHPVFLARFPAIAERAGKNLPPINPSQIFEYERAARSMINAAGLDPNNWDTYALQRLISNDIGLPELQARLQDGLGKITQAPPEVRAVFGQYFGMSSDAAMAQLFLDPTRARDDLLKMAETAYVGGIGQRFKIGLSEQIAREIADTNLSDAAVWQGFSKLDAMKSVFDETISETVDMTAENEGVDMVFGTQPGAEEAVRQRISSRVSQLSGSGGIASTEQGIVGLGVAGS